MVEFLRACSFGEFRFFRDRPELLTGGAYWFAPPGAPDFRGRHCFASRYWTRGQTFEEPAIGEQTTHGNNFYSGDSPPRIPAPVQFGDPENFVQGDPGEGRYLPETAPWGIIPEVLTGEQTALPTAIGDFDVENVGLLFLLATLCRASYEVTSTITADIVTAWLGAPDSIHFVPNSISALPGYAIIVYPQFSIVVISGTTTPQQLALQALTAGTALESNGRYATSGFWFLSGRTLVEELSLAGLPVDRPVLVVGHSYGGVLACLTAATIHLAQPDREVRLVTFGCPKPGDQRLVDILRPLTVKHIQGYGDPVPALPPGTSWFNFLALVLPLTDLRLWLQYRFAGDTSQIDDDGTISPNAETSALVRDVLLIANWLLGLTGMPSFTTHTMGRYWDRLNAAVSRQTIGFPANDAGVFAARSAYP